MSAVFYVEVSSGNVFIFLLFNTEGKRVGIMFQREGNMKNQGSTGSLWDWLNGEVSSVRKLHH